MAGPVHSKTNQFADSANGEARWQGLSPLGKRLLSAMIDSRILFDPDHMSVAGRNAALDYLEREDSRELAINRLLAGGSEHAEVSVAADPHTINPGGTTPTL